jgi:hypothetical protein
MELTYSRVIHAHLKYPLHIFRQDSDVILSTVQ